MLGDLENSTEDKKYYFSSKIMIYYIENNL